MIQPRLDTGGERFDLISVGEILFDFVAPDAGDLEEAIAFGKAPGGAPANVAVAAARLGSRVAFAGAIGADPFGHSLARLLAEEGVDVSAVRTTTAPTTLAFVARNAGGIPDFVFYRGADAELRPQDIPADILRHSAFLYVSSMALMTEPSRDATLYAVEMAREAGVLVAVDPNLRPRAWPSLDEAREAILPLVRSADVLKINDEEARLLAQTADVRRPSVRQAMETLARPGVLCVVTLGPEGCLWKLGEAEGRARAPAVEVRDTTGAGDAFMGALLSELAARGFTPAGGAELDLANLEAALTIACAAGAAACTRLGAMPALPTRKQIDDLLQS